MAGKMRTSKGLCQGGTGSYERRKRAVDDAGQGEGCAFLSRALPPEVTTRAVADFDAVVECALASMITGDGESKVGWTWRVM